MKEIVNRLHENIIIINRIIDSPNVIKSIDNAINLITKSFKKGNKVIFIGNGGSAADAQHLSAEFSGKFLLKRSGLPAIALTTNTSTITAISNDFGYEAVFQRQLEGISVGGDVLFGISTSGNSKNILNAMQYARQNSVSVIGLTGNGGGIMKDYCDILIHVQSENTPKIQECHIIIDHIICEMVEKQLFG